MYFDQTEFGKRIQKIRKEKGLTQETLAERVGITTEYMRKIESGSRSCALNILFDISEALEVSTDYLLKGTEAPIKQVKDQLEEALEKLTQIVSGIS